MILIVTSHTPCFMMMMETPTTVSFPFSAEPACDGGNIYPTSLKLFKVDGSFNILIVKGIPRIIIDRVVESVFPNIKNILLKLFDLIAFVVIAGDFTATHLQDCFDVNNEKCIGLWTHRKVRSDGSRASDKQQQMK